MQQMAASRVVRSTARSKQARAGTSTKVLLGGLRAQIPSTVHALAGCRSTFSTGGGASLRKSYGSLSRASHEKHDSAGSTVAHLPKKVGGKGKTCKSAAKRFKVTGSGKVLFHKPGKQHINRNLTSRQQRKKRRWGAIGQADIGEVRKMLPHEKGLKSGKKATSN